MPRDVQQTDRNEMIIQDAVSNSTLVLYYRHPTTAERIAFQRASWLREGTKVTNRSPEARAEYGALVLTGIREGDFTNGRDDEGRLRFIASDPESLDYDPDWKQKIVATAGDLLMLLGMQVFEGALQNLIKSANVALQGDVEGTEPEPKEGAEGDGKKDEAPEGTEEGTEIRPLEKSSNG